MARAATVSGSVVVKSADRPALSIRVTLRYVGSLQNSTTLEARGTTIDAKGHFSFSHVMPGIYVVRVNGDGIRTVQWGARGPGLAGRAVVVGSHDDIRDLTIPIVAPPVLCGRVLDFNGKPIAGAQLAAFRTNASGREPYIGLSDRDGNDGGDTKTDDRGRYRLDTLNIGWYELLAFRATSMAFDGPRIVDLETVDPHEPCHIDFHERMPRPYHGPLFRVEGRVAKAVVSSSNYAWSLSPFHRWLIDPQAQARSTPFDPATSKFAFADVAPGRYTLSLGPQSWSSSTCGRGPHEYAWAIDVKSDNLNLRFDVRPMASVQGSIKQIGAATTPRVSASYAGYGSQVGFQGPGGCISSNVSPDAAFQTEDVDPGTYQVSTSDSSGDNYVSQIVSNDGARSDDIAVLRSGPNRVTIIKRVDIGTLQAMVDANDRAEPGTPARPPLPGAEHVVLLDAAGRQIVASMSLGPIQFTMTVPPGHYIAVAGTNADFDLISTLGKSADARRLRILRDLGTTLVIRPTQITKLSLPDRTVEIQNRFAALGLPMYRDEGTSRSCSGPRCR